jgi:hypothetical protein
MSKHLSANPDFVKAFVYECFSNGFNEKQASELLNAYAKAEFYTTDKDFRYGVDSFFKEAGGLQALGQIGKSLGGVVRNNPLSSATIGTGLAAGGLMPAGILPDEYTGGAGTGAIAGGLLGLLATRGRGLGGSLSRIGSSISSGGVGRTSAKELAGLLSNPSLLKGTALGAGGGLLATGTGNLMNEGFSFSGRRPKIDPNNGMPWYMRDGAAGAQASNAAGANASAANPFELPPEVMTHMSMGSGEGQAGTNLGGPVGDLTSKKNQLLQLENQISTLQGTLPSGVSPTSYAQRQSLQSQLDNLKMQRNSLVGNIGALEKQINSDKTNMFNSATRAQQLATQGLSSTRNEFDMLRRRQQMEQEGGMLGGLMGAYNRMTGLDRQLADLDPAYAGYENEIEQARKLQELAR